MKNLHTLSDKVDLHHKINKSTRIFIFFNSKKFR